NTAPSTRYDLANRCFALKSVSANAFAVRDGAGYTASSSNAAGAEPFYLKPTALGKYLFHAKDKSLLAVSGGSIGTAAEPSDASVWTVDLDPARGFTVVSESAAQAMTVDPSNGRLILAATSGRFQFVPTTGCTAYPEISTDVVGETYKGRGVGQPVIGFAEVHTHMAMGHEMSDGSRTVGPSAGGALYGQMFNRFGAPEALKNCEAWHGPNGTRDPEATVLDMTPLKTHDTQGWPSFIDWPGRDSQLHQAMYYKWVERAWKAGLRILVSEGTNIEALCQVAQVYESTVNPAAASTIDCNDMNLGINQVKYLFELQDYVDAQEGGPGKGWFRIVKNPAEARAVINDGKLAVVPGLEFSNIFRCNVVFDPAGNETRGCTREDIDRQIEEVWDLGVRELFPYHDVN
ncbi:MAG: peptidase M19, partial [Nevskiales bacterium]